MISLRSDVFQRKILFNKKQSPESHVNLGGMDESSGPSIMLKELYQMTDQSQPAHDRHKRSYV